jgi:hypothetical protein
MMMNFKFLIFTPYITISYVGERVLGHTDVVYVVLYNIMMYTLKCYIVIRSSPIMYTTATATATTYYYVLTVKVCMLVRLANTSFRLGPCFFFRHAYSHFPFFLISFFPSFLLCLCRGLFLLTIDEKTCDGGNRDVASD